MAQDLGYVKALAKKHDALLVDLEFVNMAADSLTLGAVADEQKIDIVVVGKYLGGSINEKIVALYRTKVGNSDNELGLGGFGRVDCAAAAGRALSMSWMREVGMCTTRVRA